MKSIISRIKHRFKTSPRNRVIKNFAEKNGLVYFGFVDQHSDEHRVVRGLTVSATHQDANYSVGTIDGYNVTIVDRGDNEKCGGKMKHFSWLIMAFDLHTDYRIPHFLINATGRDKDHFHALFSSFPNMLEADDETIHKYGDDFNSRFKLYARPAKLGELEQIITVNVARAMGVHFWPLSIEQHDNVLYLYADNSRITESSLSVILKNGLFLAHNLDSESDKLIKA